MRPSPMTRSRAPCASPWIGPRCHGANQAATLKACCRIDQLTHRVLAVDARADFSRLETEIRADCTFCSRHRATDPAGS